MAWFTDQLCKAHTRNIMLQPYTAGIITMRKSQLQHILSTGFCMHIQTVIYTSVTLLLNIYITYIFYINQCSTATNMDSLSSTFFWQVKGYKATYTITGNTLHAYLYLFIHSTIYAQRLCTLYAYYTMVFFYWPNVREQTTAVVI